MPGWKHTKTLDDDVSQCVGETNGKWPYLEGCMYAKGYKLQ